MADQGAGSVATRYNATLTQPAIFQALEGKKNVLIAGCGGGYDVYAGIPLLLALRNLGVNVHLANLSFTNLEDVKGTRMTDKCVRVAASDENITDPAKTSGGGRGFNYFPEYYLSKFFLDNHGWDVPVYTVDRSAGVVQLSEAYTVLQQQLDVDAVVSVDGGTDSLMFGDEQKLGTPTEDSTSIAAIHSMTAVETKLLVCLGFGVDHFHGVSHHLFLENTATLTQDGGYLGAFSVTREMEEGQMLLSLYDYVAKVSLDSIVCSSVCNAIRGKFGNVQESPRTFGSELYINPLMSLYWCYNLSAVARRMPHMPALLKTQSRAEVGAAISRHRESLDAYRESKPIPL